jgi:hypothetical protein
MSTVKHDICACAQNWKLFSIMGEGAGVTSAFFGWASFHPQIKNLIPKLKRQLRPNALASLSGARAFLQTRSAVGLSGKDDLIALLKDKRNQDIL